MSQVCVWEDGPVRDSDDHDGLREDIAKALGAPLHDVEIQSSRLGETGIGLTVTIHAPFTYQPLPNVDEEVPW